MQRRVRLLDHDASASPPAIWRSHRSYTFSYASLSAAQGVLIYGTAAASLAKQQQQLTDAAAQARGYAACRCRSVSTALQPSSLPLRIRRLRPSPLASAPFIATRKCPLHTASPPPSSAESVPQCHTGSDRHDAVPIPSPAAAATDSTRRPVARRRRQAKRVTASSESVAARDEPQASEESDRHGRDVCDTSSSHHGYTSQPLPASTAPQRPPTPARHDERIPGQRSAYLEAARLPASPTRHNATPESICSYLLTLRRALSCNRAGTHFSSMTRRSALAFMHQILPTLMTMPPVPEADLLTGAVMPTPGGGAAVERCDVESGITNAKAGAALESRQMEPPAHLSFPPPPPSRASPLHTPESISASADGLRRLRGCGQGSVPWTQTLAEAVLLMCNKLDCDVRHMWAARAALLYLVLEEGKDCTDPPQPPPASLSTLPRRLTRTPGNTLNEKAQLALALMRTLDAHYRQSRLTRDVLRPVTVMLALQLREKVKAASSSDKLCGHNDTVAEAPSERKSHDTRAVRLGDNDKAVTQASSAPHAASAHLPRRDSALVNLERYLTDALLPLLYSEFRHYCRSVEQWQDYNDGTAAAAAAAAPQHQHTPSPSAPDNQTCLPNIAPADIETFSLLAAVLHRALGLHSVVREGNEVYFDLSTRRADGHLPVAPKSHKIVSEPSGSAGASAGASLPRRGPRYQPAVPLHAFRLTIEAITARLDADGGPHTGAQELIARNSMQARAGYGARAHSPPPFVPPRTAAPAGAPRVSSGGSGSQSPASPSSKSRFVETAAPSSARLPHAPSAEAEREGGGHDGKSPDSATTGSGSLRTKTTASSPVVKFGNFNIGRFLPILSLCSHDHSFSMFVTTATAGTGTHASTTSASGSTTSSSPTTGAETSALVEEDVSALAAAISRLLLLGIYWAPLCRTYQLPTVLTLFARATTAEMTHTAVEKSAPAAEAASGLRAASSHPTAAEWRTRTTQEAVPMPLDATILQRVRDTFVPPATDLAAPSSSFAQQLNRLVYSSRCYLERVNFGTFANMATTLDRVLCRWPIHNADVATTTGALPLSGNPEVGCGSANDDSGGGDGGFRTASTAAPSDGGEVSSPAAKTFSQQHDVVARAASTMSAAHATDIFAGPHAKGSRAVFRAPVAAGMATLHIFAPIAEEFWSRERGRILWQAVSRRARQRVSVLPSTDLTRAHLTKHLGFTVHTCMHTRLRVTVPNTNGDGTTTAASEDGVQECIKAPFYILRLMGLRSAAAERIGTPDEVLRVYQMSERAESYMAVQNALGCTTAARPFICEYLRSDFMWRTIPNDTFVPLVTALAELELSSMTVPEHLLVSGSLEYSADLKQGPTASWGLQGRLAGCFLSNTMRSLKARVEPHELRLLTADDREAYTFGMEPGARQRPQTAATATCHGDDRLALLHLSLRRISKDGRVLDPPQLAPTMPSAGRGGTGVRGSVTPSSRIHHPPHQGDGGAQTPPRFVGAPTCYNLEATKSSLWEPAYSRSSDESVRMPLTAFPPLLRAMTLLAEAERRVDQATLHDAAGLRSDGASPDSSKWPSCSEAFNLDSVDLILRMAWRLLFESASGSSAVAERSETVSLEALVTLYLSLTGVASQWPASPRPPATTSVSGTLTHEVGVSAKVLVPPSTALAVDCCLAHCEVALRQRLMAMTLQAAGSGAAEATQMKPERIATDLPALLQLAVLTERLLPCAANMAAPATGAADMPLHELIHRQLLRELRTSLRQASLQRIAGEVSRLVWWITRRAHAEVREDGTSPLSPRTSWVETTLLQEIDAKRLAVAERATVATAPSTSSCSSASHRSFQIFEWALLPFYAKLEARQHDANAAAETADKAAAALSEARSTSTPTMDDFLCLEDTYSGCAGECSAHWWSPQSSLPPVSTGLPSGATTSSANSHQDGGTTAFQASHPRAAPHTVTLEAALHALPTQCDSFHILLHVVRQLFLSHPALLSTTPDAALYYEIRTARAASDHKITTPVASCASTPVHILGAAGGRQAWATLPTQRVELPHDMRQRYVNALFRCFKRLVYHQTCTAEELVELLHVLWLADPHASHVAFSVASSSSKASTSQWPSLFALCSDFVKRSLAELDAAADMQDMDDTVKGDNGVGESPRPLRSVPEVLQIVYRTMHDGLSKSIVTEPRDMHWLSVNAMALHPRSVILFLHCLNIVRGLEEQRQPRQRAHDSLNRLHRSTLELFQPFIVYASITGEAVAGAARTNYMPLLLESLSEMDPQLLLVLIQATFAGAMWSGNTGRPSQDRGRGRSRRERVSSGNTNFYRKMLVASQTTGGPVRMGEYGHRQSARALAGGGVQDTRQLLENIAAVMAALLMVASHVQASSGVWTSKGGAGGHEGMYSAMTAPATPQRGPSARIGGAHHRALIFLRNSLYELLLRVRSPRPLQCASAVTVVQLMQLGVVRESPRMVRLLDGLFLSSLIPPVQIVERAVAPATTAATVVHRDSEKGDKYGLAIPRDTIGGMRFPASHEAVQLLRLLPVQYWRILLHRDVFWPRYRGYALQMLNKRWRSVAMTRGDTLMSDTAHRSKANKWKKMNSSLSFILLSLDTESIACLVKETMGPMVLLVVAAELLRVLARQRACSGDRSTATHTEVDGMPRAVHSAMRTAPRIDKCQCAKADEWPAGITARRDAGEDDAPALAAWTSFEVVRCYASPGSVLTDEAVQPWLEAACNVIDQLASTRHTDFVLMLEREAEWKRRVMGASAYRGAAAEEVPLGVFHQTAVEAMAAARVGTKEDARETAASVLDIGEDGVAEVSDASGSAEERDWAELRTSAGAPAARDDVSALGDSVSNVGNRKRSVLTTGFVASTSTALDDAAGEWSDASDTAPEQPLVLDWRPITDFVRTIREVDPGISQRQVRLECWLRRPELVAGASAEARALSAARMHPFSSVSKTAASAASLEEAAVTGGMDDARDVLHNAAGAILQHARVYWQTTDCTHGARPLLLMNLRDALNLYCLDTQQICERDDSVADAQLVRPTDEGDIAETLGGTASSTDKGSARDSSVVVEQSRWLECGTASSSFDRGIDPAAERRGLSTTMVLGLVRPCPALSVPWIGAPRAMVDATVTGERKRRRLALLRRAGVLASAQEMEERCRAYGLSCTMWQDGAQAWQATSAAEFWRRKSRRLQLEVLECVIGDDDATEDARERLRGMDGDAMANGYAGAAGRERVATASATGCAVRDECLSDVERRVRHRLQLLRCDDLAQLLLLMTSEASAVLPSPSAKAGVKRNTNGSLSLLRLRMRVIMETVDELLPSASTNELMQVVLALLKLSISAEATDASSTDAMAPPLLHYVCREARRLLANVAVLVANDAERFTSGELLWLITRLHTPCVRAAVPPHAPPAQKAAVEAAVRRGTLPRLMHDKVPWDAPLDVSMSYMSAAVARAIGAAIAGSHDPTGGGRGDGADADEAIGDGTDVPVDRSAALNDKVSIDVQSASPVTVAQWVNAVAEAEQLQGKSKMQYVLQLVELSAV
ncbi:hypothetical protein, unknown function [Leishmania tarentolae]|uniref:Uncharacterized protein n=1 Tax=Leishmania tarentolae TaxID=5689 RepID=A0A640K8R8_LEITA|nr:hypothetical protein, unknown function [Leishmania tarentolae]